MQNKITNPLQVTSALVIGPKRETGKIKNALEAIAGRKILVEPILTIKESTTQKLQREQILPALLEKLKKSDSRTLVITDIGDDRPYKGEQIALDVKENSSAAFVLITSNTCCIGSPEKFAAFMAERGFDPALVMPKIDYTFQYAGISEIFPAMVELHESRLNYKNDSERLILVFEGKPKFYSGYLSELFKLNEQRTHILLARTYEEARSIVMEGKNRFAGAILGMHDPEHTFGLLKILRAYNKGLPVIMQSSAPERVKLAEENGSVIAINKNVMGHMVSIGKHLQEYFGFGDFIFRTPERIEIGRAKNLKELCEFIEKIDDASLVSHASRNDFSNWLYLHGYKTAAETIKPMFTDSAEILRPILLSDLKPFIQ